MGERAVFCGMDKGYDNHQNWVRNRLVAAAPGAGQCQRRLFGI